MGPCSHSFYSMPVAGCNGTVNWLSHRAGFSGFCCDTPDESRSKLFGKDCAVIVPSFYRPETTGCVTRVKLTSVLLLQACGSIL